MQEKELRTTWKQRVFIIVIAVLMLGSTLAVYISIVMAGSKQSQQNAENAAEVAKLQQQLTKKQAELSKETTKLSEKYFKEFSNYKSNVKSYNATAVNNKGLQKKDLKKGTGTEITAKNNDYYAYYIGWCADESVFDSSFSPEFKKPTSLKDPISGQMSLIAGWTEGVVGMKIGGVRQLEIPGELAYGNTQEIWGGKNSPLKFIMMAIDPGKTYKDLMQEYQLLSFQIQAMSSADNSSATSE